MADEKETQSNVEDESKETESESKETEKQTEAQEKEELFTKEQVNEIVQGRLAKERKKYEGFSDYKENAEKAQGLQEKYDKVSAELETLKHEKSVSEWKAKASSETGIDPKILRGDTEEEIFEHAKAIKDTISYPEVKQGDNPNGDKIKVSPHEKLVQGLERGNFWN